MVLRKRLSALIIASVMVLTLSLPVFAISGIEFEYDEQTDSFSSVTVPTQYIGDITYNEYMDFASSTDTLSFPTESNNRYFYIPNAITVGLNVYNTQYETPEILPAINVTAAGLYVATPDPDRTYGYNISNVTGENNNNRAIGTTRYSYYDTYVQVDYPFNSTEKINVTGTWESVVYTEYSNATVAITPDVLYLLINGQEVGEGIVLDDNGSATVNAEFVLTEDVESVGFRAYFSSNGSWYAYKSNITASGAGYDYPVNLWLKETLDWQITEKDDPTPGLLQSLLDWIIGIYNSVFVPDSQKDDADAFQSEVSGTVTEADNVKTELDELEKPEPEEIDTDLSGIISDETYTQQTQIFVDLLKFEKITNMLMIVFTMALISYVLFGKKG